jgi:hypothetical protein
VGRNSDINFEFSIAGICTQIVFHDFPAEKAERFLEDYSSFAFSGTNDIPSVSVRIKEGNLFIPLSEKGLQIETTYLNRRFQFVSYHEQGWFDLKSGQGELVLRPDGHPENFLRVLYAWRCLEQGALLLHASGLLHNGQGYVFFGRSGSGKTTITRLSQGSTVLSDDLVIIQPKATLTEGVWVYGVPFRGELVNAPRTNASSKLGGLFSLVKDERHHIEPISEAEAVAKLAACVPFVMSQPQNVSQVLELCRRINRHKPVSALHFHLDPGFWSLIDG